jgi:hypothetical protein
MKPRPSPGSDPCKDLAEISTSNPSTHSSGPPQGNPGDTLDLLQTETLERLSRLLLVLAQLDRDRVGSVVVDGELFDGHGGRGLRC